MRHASRKDARASSRHDPAAWRRAWEAGGAADWPREPVTGIVESGGIRIVIDRCDITSTGHLWLDGWALGPATADIELAARRCTVDWQSTFATARPDVVEALQLSLLGREAHVGIQVLARVADYAPERSRLALTVRGHDGVPSLVVPAVPQSERSGNLWHAVYDAMRHRGPRDAAYLETSVRLLKDLRKADWRERTAAIRRSIDDAMGQGPGLKVLVLSRHHPNVAYLNLHLLAAARIEPCELIVCSMGQAAIQRANEYRGSLATLGAHDVGFVSAEVGTPSSELIEQFVLSCQQRHCPGLVVYDDVAVAGAMKTLTTALRQDAAQAMAWPRQFPHAGPTEIAFAEPLAASDGPGPYWRTARSMEQGGVGAVLFPPSRLDIPPVPPFEGRGYGLEYLLKSALADASLSQEPMLDLVDPAGQREAQGLDMLMLIAS